MANPLIRKLSAFNALGHDDLVALEGLCQSQGRRKAGSDLIHEGDRPENVFLLVHGWACRYKLVEDGSRQITAYLLPGDLCDPHVFILDEMDHSIGLLTDAVVVTIPKRAIIEITERSPAIARALWWSALVDEAVLRQWLVIIGQLDAFERLAHLFCELWQRLDQVGRTHEGAFNLPLTQQQLGDTVGLTSVHVNRVLHRMRAEGLIAIEAKHLTILDRERMHEISGFNPRYLHLNRRPS